MRWRKIEDGLLEAMNDPKRGDYFIVWLPKSGRAASAENYARYSDDGKTAVALGPWYFGDDLSAEGEPSHWLDDIDPPTT